MAPLTSARYSVTMAGDMRSGSVAAGELICGGSVTLRNAVPFLVAGTAATGLTGAGRSDERVDNTAGANGDARVSDPLVSFGSKCGQR